MNIAKFPYYLTQVTHGAEGTLVGISEPALLLWEHVPPGLARDNYVSNGLSFSLIKHLLPRSLHSTAILK